MRGLPRVSDEPDRRCLENLEGCPGVFPVLHGHVSSDGITITGHWEASQDGSDWKPDFDVTYAKTR